MDKVKTCAGDDGTHRLYGFPEVFYHKSQQCKWIRLILLFGLGAVILPIVDILTDFASIITLWIYNPCDISVWWLIIISTVPFLPFVFSLIKERIDFYYEDVDAYAVSQINWRLARHHLVRAEEQLLVDKPGEKFSIHHSTMQAAFLPTWRSRLVIEPDVFPMSLFYRWKQFYIAWRDAPNIITKYRLQRHQFDEIDIEYHDLLLQRALLAEIKYESSLQLIIQLVLLGTGLQPVWWIPCASAVVSLLSIAKYFPSAAQLPGKYAFNRKLFQNKDGLSLWEANELLKPLSSLLYGSLSNFLYIACRYHLIILLIRYNWLAAAMVVLLQFVMVLTFVLGSYLLVRRKYRAPPNDKNRHEDGHVKTFSSLLKRRLGPLYAFCSQLCSTASYFLLVPVTTTTTGAGCVLAVVLQTAALTVYVTITQAQWNRDICCRSERLYEHTLGPSAIWLLAINGIVSCLVLPAAHYFLEFRAGSTRSLRHRSECWKCQDFQSSYLEYRPCWLCEWMWQKNRRINREADDRVNVMFAEGNFRNGQHYPDVQITWPAPFFGNTKPSFQTNGQYIKEAAHQILLIAAEISRLRKHEGDLLLCDAHRQDLSESRIKADSEREERVYQLMSARLDDVSAEGQPSTSRQTSYDFDQDVLIIREYLRSSNLKMYTFLVRLYAYRAIPFQLLFKSVLYDGGIRQRDRQSLYWFQMKQLRKEHRCCASKCNMSYEEGVTQDISVYEVAPPYLPAFKYKVNLADRNHYNFHFAGTFFMLKDKEGRPPAPLRQCPWKPIPRTPVNRLIDDDVHSQAAHKAPAVAPADNSNTAGRVFMATRSKRMFSPVSHFQYNTKTSLYTVALAGEKCMRAATGISAEQLANDLEAAALAFGLDTADSGTEFQEYEYD
ncbi:uncharacterized protein LOC129590935 [Paramacrobiotus metropolitanus]|uniref:uncharacterized protein LOC129590935 n=1 Tax=Paramacrobiotus metropolitanus TaxID=2943436 RepID=UPI002445ECAC|nr:uncharacterized protein LOC129590935 [Paramacrobiotus metropolitanus]